MNRQCSLCFIEKRTSIHQSLTHSLSSFFIPKLQKLLVALEKSKKKLLQVQSTPNNLFLGVLGEQSKTESIKGSGRMFPIELVTQQHIYATRPNP
jgi:hypothetical protein